MVRNAFLLPGMEVKLISSAAHGRCNSLSPSILTRLIMLETIPIQVITQPRHASLEHSHDWVLYPSHWRRSPACIPLRHGVPLCTLLILCLDVCRAHVAKKHEEKAHECNECGKTFSYYNQLRVHMVQHARKVCKTL